MHIYRDNKIPLHTQGFSLIETLVAIMLLITAVSGVLTVASKSLYLTSVAREQLTAFYLAQEPIENIRNVRDSNRLQTSATPWLTHLSECVSADGSLKCIIDRITEGGYPPSANAIVTCGALCPQISFSPSRGLYSYAGGSDWAASKFVRTTSVITPIGTNADEARIDVTVSWPVGTVTRSVTIREYISNW